MGFNLPQTLTHHPSSLLQMTLKLVLKKKWFDLILSCEKKEEYREIKPYWVKRLTGYEFGDLEQEHYIKYLQEGLRLNYDTEPGADTAVYPQPGRPPDPPKLPTIDRSWWPILALGCLVIVVFVVVFQKQIDR
jgi:hypothetical protein